MMKVNPVNPMQGESGSMKRNIILVGSMGSGKSHIGRNLAESRDWQFVDTDRLLEKQYRIPIAKVYEKLGEKGFRKAEMNILKTVSMYHEAVISVGGNFPMELRTLRALQRYSYVVGIRAAEYRIVNRVSRRIGKRPTMDYGDLTGFVENMVRRWRPMYRKCDFVLDTTFGKTDELVAAINEDLAKSKIEFKKRKQFGGNHEDKKSGHSD